MILSPQELDTQTRYQLLISSILPRPIAWVSTISNEGLSNLAPFSYFTGVCNDPMTLLFCPVVPNQQGSEKDTLKNIRQIPEFVIQIATEQNAEKMNQTAAPLPYGTSEFDWAEIEAVPSTKVRPPRVANAEIAFECSLQRLVTVSDKPGGGFVVFGEVQCIHVEDELYDPTTGKISLELLRPIGRLGGNRYATTRDTIEMERPTL